MPGLIPVRKFLDVRDRRCYAQQPLSGLLDPGVMTLLDGVEDVEKQHVLVVTVANEISRRVSNQLPRLFFAPVKRRDRRERAVCGCALGELFYGRREPPGLTL